LAAGSVMALALAGCASTTRAKPATVGSTLTLNDGMGDTVNVTLLKFEDPAPPAGPTDAPPAGDNLAEVLIKVTGLSGTYKYDADDAVAVVGSNNQTYAGGPGRLAGCYSFESGQVSVAPGRSAIGCVAVEITKGIKAAKIEYDAGYVGTTGIWIP